MWSSISPVIPMYFIRRSACRRLISVLRTAALNKATTASSFCRSERQYSALRSLTDTCPDRVDRVSLVPKARVGSSVSSKTDCLLLNVIRFVHGSNRPHWSVYNMACPGNKMRWDLGPEDLKKEADLLIAKSKAAYDAVGSLTPEEVTIENVVKVSLCVCLIHSSHLL